VRHPGKTAVIGETVTIQCHSSNLNPVNWWYQRTADELVTELVVNGELINGYSQRFSLNSSNYDLTLRSAKWTDRGIYTCIEDTGFNTRHITRLTVEGMHKCTSIVLNCAYCNLLFCSCLVDDICLFLSPFLH